MINQQLNNFIFPNSGYPQNYHNAYGTSYSIPANCYSPISPNIIPFGNMNIVPQFPVNQIINENINKQIAQMPNN